ncbi:hypothetical protein GCM10018772_25560 [Streptomyces fumanus]|uniref:Uncharacterized protein n=1 Tax=Streptomyces fumanus TaxID=67302 RepID=A0A919AD99_9ACTN|nr:hypothetical protein GCM10018772_25560 [Streptomyces fumanus]
MLWDGPKAPSGVLSYGAGGAGGSVANGTRSRRADAGPRTRTLHAKQTKPPKLAKLAERPERSHRRRYGGRAPGTRAGAHTRRRSSTTVAAVSTRARPPSRAVSYHWTVQ